METGQDTRGALGEQHFNFYDYPMMQFLFIVNAMKAYRCNLLYSQTAVFSSYSKCCILSDSDMFSSAVEVLN